MAFLLTVCALLATAVPAARDAGARWSADFSSGDFRQWSWWGQGDPSYGHISVVDARRHGIPAPPVATGRGRVARMAVTRDDVRRGHIHAKLYKGWSRHGRPPRNVSGTYSAWYYVPKRYAVPRGTDANIFQFKEKHGGRSDPLWWVQLATASWAKGMRGARWVGPQPRRADQPIAVLNHAGNAWRRRLVFMAIPLGRWFEIRAMLRQRDRIDFTIDGRRFDTARQREYPVTPFRRDGQEWTFGIGNYTDAPGTVIYLGPAAYTRP